MKKFVVFVVTTAAASLIGTAGCLMILRVLDLVEIKIRRNNKETCVVNNYYHIIKEEE